MAKKSRYKKQKSAKLGINKSEDNKNQNIKIKNQVNDDYRINKQIKIDKPKRGKMEVLVYVFAAIAVILAVFVTIFFYYNKQTFAIWTVFFLICSTTLACCLQWQIWVWNQHGEVTALALEKPTFTENVKECTFDFGTNVATIPISILEKQPQKPFNINGIAPIMYVKNRKFYVDITVSDPDQLFPVQIKEGRLTITPTNWDTNSNDSAYEVVDEKLNVVFQIIYNKSSKVFLYGVFPDPQVQGQLVFVSEKGIKTAFNKPDDFNIKRQFKYPSWKYPGQFDDP